MMYGAFKGACLAKTVVPYSRIPGLILACAVVFTLPFLTAVLSTVRSFSASVLMLFAVLAFMLSNLAYFPAGHFLAVNSSWNVLQPMGHVDAYHAITRRQRFSLICNLACVALLIAFVFSTFSVMDLAVMGIIDMSLHHARENLIYSRVFWTFMATYGLKFVCTLYGTTKISTVFFADA